MTYAVLYIIIAVLFGWFAKPWEKEHERDWRTGDERVRETFVFCITWPMAAVLLIFHSAVVALVFLINCVKAWASR